MSAPTIQQRLEKRLIVMTTDASFVSEVFPLCEERSWQARVVTDIDDLGGWGDVLLYRLLLLDLDEVSVFDPLDVIRVIRMQMQINIPVLCFGGDECVRDEMRLARADRFFDRQEMLKRLPQFLDQYRW